VRAQKNNIFSGIDLPLILLYLTLVLFGWMNIYAASISDEQTFVLDLSTKYGKQLLWIGLSFVLILGILFIEAKTYEKFASLIYIASLLSLICLFFF
jgi:rod shape determining protein RodA